MNLLSLIGSARKALSFFGGSPRSSEPWANNAEAFQIHFGVPYEAFLEIVGHLSPKQENLLHATMELNPEAAVLWILAMEEVDE